MDIVRQLMDIVRQLIKGKMQRHDQSAFRHIAHIREVGYQFWIGVPTSVDTFISIIDTIDTRNIKTI
jgi:hypothetical protein